MVIRWRSQGYPEQMVKMEHPGLPGADGIQMAHQDCTVSRDGQDGAPGIPGGDGQDGAPGLPGEQMEFKMAHQDYPEQMVKMEHQGYLEASDGQDGAPGVRRS